MCRVPVNERRCRSNESCDDLDKKFVKYIRISDEPFLRRGGGVGLGNFFQKLPPQQKLLKTKLCKGSDGVKN